MEWKRMTDVKFGVYIGSQVVATVLLLAFIVLWPGTWNGQRIAGSIVLIVGVGLLSLARFQLGRSFSITAQAKKLVTHGLYSKIRNPVYVFGAVAMAGFFMIVQKPALWVLFAFIVVMQIARARKEAQVLEAKFGDEYRAYRAQTWF
jgi:protein-S-isoprenylcysteine O-methyltransferase Ste14